MDTNAVSAVLGAAACFLLGGLALYYQASAKLKGAVSGLISEAEALYNDAARAGGVKHAYVTEKLYRMLPVFLKPILTKAVISSIVDNAFASIQDYARQQLDKAVDKIISTPPDAGGQDEQV